MTGDAPATPAAGSETTPELRRAIPLSHATSMVVGTIIGASIFVQQSEITSLVPSSTGVILVWFICGLLTLFGALVCAELASVFPKTGGVYVYLREAFSPALGFLWGWAMFWTMHTGIIAAVSMVFARYVGFFVPLDDLGIRVVAIGVILTLSVVNYVGVKQGSTLQALFTLGKLIAIGLMIIVGFAFGRRAEPAALATIPAPPGDFGPVDFTLALVAGLFAFGGWHLVTYNAEETIDARRTIPRALVGGVVIVTVCYIGLNAVYMSVLPIEAVAASTRVAADAAEALFGFGGGAVISGLVIFSTFGMLTGSILSAPRVYYAMGQDGVLFRWVGAIHPRHRTPHRALLLQAIWASVLVSTGTYHELFIRVIYTEWIFFGLLAVGLMRLRSRPGLAREYEIWGYPWVPIVFAVSAFGIVANQIVSDPRESVVGLGMVLIGLPVYAIWGRKGLRTGPRP